MLRRSPLRRRSPLKMAVTRDPIPPKVREAVKARDRGCVFVKLGIEHRCYGLVQLDHVRASGGLGMKSPSTPDNLVCLCPWAHQMKTLDGRKYRPLLLAYLARVAA